MKEDLVARMSKTRNKTHSEVEHLKGEVKSLKAQNRYLKRRLKQFEKYSKDDYIEVEKLEVNLCQVCGKGEMSLLDLKYVKYRTCGVCEYKERV